MTITPEDAPGQGLLFEDGSEFAPDAPWGRDRLFVGHDGALRYENLDHGRHRVVTGRLTGGHAERLFSLLAASGFPSIPAHRCPPGYGITSLTVFGPAEQWSVSFDYYVSAV